MTVTQLYKILAKEIANKNGRCRVAIDKATFQSNLESDGVTIMDVHEFETSFINIADGDGGTEVNKDGSERMRLTFVLYGDSREATP